MYVRKYMLSFKIWLEDEEKDFEFYKNLVLGKLNLDRSEGLSATLNTWEPENLISMLNSLGEFKELSDETQEQVIGKVRAGEGTLADLIRMIATQGPELK
jgi:hypothetical protein